MPIGDNLKTIREERKLTQQELGKISGLTSGYISKIEKNLVNPSADKVKKLVIALEITADRLLFDEEEKEPSEEFKEIFKKASNLDVNKKNIIKEVMRAYITQSISEELKN